MIFNITNKYNITRKYNWTNKDIQNCVEELLKKAQEEPEKKGYYLKVANEINSFIKKQQIDDSRIKISTKALLSSTRENYYYYERYYELIKLFNEAIEPDEETINMLINDFEIEEHDIKYIKNEEALTIIHDFFKEIDEELFKYFDELYKNRHELIKFTTNDNDIFSKFEGGYCFFVEALRKNFICIEDDIGLDKLAVIAHECGHAVANLYDPIGTTYAKDTFLGEIESLFFEIVCENDIIKKQNQYEASISAISKLDNFEENTKALLLHKPIIECYEKTKYEVNKPFYQEIKERKITRNKLKESINTDIEESGSYIISYMVALELFNIYKQDKKSALQILKQMLKMRTEDSLIVINKFFPYFDNIKNEIKTIQKDLNNELIKKLNK